MTAALSRINQGLGYDVMLLGATPMLAQHHGSSLGQEVAHVTIGNRLLKQSMALRILVCISGGELGVSALLEVAQLHLMLGEQVVYGRGQAWEHGGYSDDLIVAAQCNSHGLRILCPAFALFPQWCACQMFVQPQAAG